MAEGAAPLSAATSNASVEEMMRAKEKKENFKTVSKLESHVCQLLRYFGSVILDILV